MYYITGIKVLGILSCPEILGNCNDRMLELRVEINKETSGAAMEKFATIRNYLSMCGSSNSSNIISFISSENNIPIRRIDPSLPEGYMRYWNTKCRGYVYYDSESQIVLHPLGPKLRKYSDPVKRVPKIRVPTVAYATKLLMLPPVMREPFTKSQPMKGGEFASGSGSEVSDAEVSAAKASSATASSAMASSAMASGSIALSFKPAPMDVRVLLDITLPPPWVKYFDTKIRKFFYVHPALFKQEWEHPVIPPQPTKNMQSYTDISLPVPWKKYLDPKTEIFYYYDTKTTETTWDHPYPPPYPENLTQIEMDNLSPLYAKFKYPNNEGELNSFYYNTITTETFWDFSRPTILTKAEQTVKENDKRNMGEGVKAVEQVKKENQATQATQADQAAEASEGTEENQDAEGTEENQDAEGTEENQDAEGTEENQDGEGTEENQLNNTA
jgi:hypothetical protein